MAAPAYIAASTGEYDVSGAWTATCHAPGASGRLIILQVLQDGTGAEITQTSATNITSLAGAADAFTVLCARQAVGSSTAAYQYLWVGRSASTTAPTFTGANSGGDDLYYRMYEFSGVNTGTTVSHIVENATAGAVVNKVATSATAAAGNLTTLGADRLGLAFVAINDDNAIGSFTGESGGNWAEAVAEYATASGTDGCIQLQTTAMAAAGTVTGGTATITDSDAWGCITLALVGTTGSTTAVGEISLASANIPATRTRHDILVRARVTSMAGLALLNVALYEGATDRSGTLSATLTASLADYTLAISDANAANITSYNDLSVRFWGTEPCGRPCVFEVDYLCLRTPDFTAIPHGRYVYPQLLPH